MIDACSAFMTAIARPASSSLFPDACGEARRFQSPSKRARKRRMSGCQLRGGMGVRNDGGIPRLFNNNVVAISVLGQRWGERNRSTINRGCHVDRIRRARARAIGSRPPSRPCTYQSPRNVAAVHPVWGGAMTKSITTRAFKIVGRPPDGATNIGPIKKSSTSTRKGITTDKRPIKKMRVTISQTLSPHGSTSPSSPRKFSTNVSTPSRRRRRRSSNDCDSHYAGSCRKVLVGIDFAHNQPHRRGKRTSPPAEKKTFGMWNTTSARQKPVIRRIPFRLLFFHIAFAPLFPRLPGDHADTSPISGGKKRRDGS